MLIALAISPTMLRLMVPVCRNLRIVLSVVLAAIANSVCPMPLAFMYATILAAADGEWIDADIRLRLISADWFGLSTDG